jgi:hypothetical protein
MLFYIVQEALCPLQDCKITCLHILHDVLHLEKFKLLWIPHSLDSNQKTERVTLSHGLVEVLEKYEENDLHNVLTGDKSWLLLEYPHESAWSASRDKVPGL